VLSRALAELGRGDVALIVIRRSVELTPPWRRSYYQLYLVDVAAIAGRTGEAIQALEASFGLPLVLTVPRLRADPRFEPLRGDPRFEAMLARHERQPGTP
jgi:hypothetical protein